MTTLELCDKYFDTKDIYKLFGVEKTANEKDLKKAYYKLSLLVHPDRVPEAQKAAATEKFKLLSKLYQTLTDKDKRALYDEQGIIDDDDNLEGKLNNWMELWRKLFKPLTTEDINNYAQSYIGSDVEKTDIKKAYLGGKGCINYMMNHVPFMNVEDEPRIQEIVREMIDNDEVPEYTLFTKEPGQKRKRRHQKYARESKEAEEIKEKIEMNKKNETEMEVPAGLEQAIMARQRSREDGFNSLMDRLVAKYSNEDDEEYAEPTTLRESKGKKKQKKQNAKEKGKPLNAVKNGKVKKRKN